MDRLIDWVKSNASAVLAIPAAIGGAEFFINLAGAMSDGYISGEELHTLVALASPAQMLIIVAVMLVLKKGK